MADILQIRFPQIVGLRFYINGLDTDDYLSVR
jgi:hypothetical protein